jgi:hypothetical protein
MAVSQEISGNMWEFPNRETARNPVQPIGTGCPAGRWPVETRMRRFGNRATTSMPIVTLPYALILTHILLGKLKVIGWNLSNRFWRTPHISKA